MFGNLQSSPVSGGNGTSFNVVHAGGSRNTQGDGSSNVAGNTQGSSSAAGNSAAIRANIPLFVPPVSNNNNSAADVEAAQHLTMLAGARRATQPNARVAAEGLFMLANGQAPPQSEAGIRALADAAAAFTLANTIPPGLTNVAHLPVTGRNAPSTAPFTYKDTDGQEMFTLQVTPGFRWVDHGNGIISICKSLTGHDGQEQLEHAAWIEHARQDGTPGSDDARMAFAFLQRVHNA